jgi:hypothetical protein
VPCGDIARQCEHNGRRIRHASLRTALSYRRADDRDDQDGHRAVLRPSAVRGRSAQHRVPALSRNAPPGGIHEARFRTVVLPEVQTGVRVRRKGWLLPRDSVTASAKILKVCDFRLGQTTTRNLRSGIAENRERPYLVCPQDIHWIDAGCSSGRFQRSQHRHRDCDKRDRCQHPRVANVAINPV